MLTFFFLLLLKLPAEQCQNRRRPPGVPEGDRGGRVPVRAGAGHAAGDIAERVDPAARQHDPGDVLSQPEPKGE